MRELVNHQRTPVAADLLIRPEHEVIDEQLRAPLEEIEQGRLSVWALELVLLLDPHDRLAPPLRGQGVTLPCQLFLLGDDPLVRRLSLLERDHFRQFHDRSFRVGTTM